MRTIPSRPILPRGKAEDPGAILRTAADIVELPGAWRQGALAEDDRGVECSATDARTARVCTHGALHRATREGCEEQTGRARLDLDKDVKPNLKQVRRMWCEEPSVRGTTRRRTRAEER